MGTRPLSPPGPPGLSPPELEGCQRLWWGWGDVAGMLLAQSARSKPCISLRQSLGHSGPLILCLSPSQAPSQNVVQWRGVLCQSREHPPAPCQGKERHLGIPKWPQSHQQSPQHIWSISLTQPAPKNIPELILGRLCPLQPLPPKPAQGSEFSLPSPLLQEGEIWEPLALSRSPALHLLPSHPWLLAGLFWVPGFIKKGSFCSCATLAKR